MDNLLQQASGKLERKARQFAVDLIDIVTHAADRGVNEVHRKKGVLQPLPYVPFVNRPFESEIRGTVNFTQFCCVLLVTWCYRVLLSCYLRPK